MRTLLLTRGAPGAGKTTWIADNGLKAYTLSPDDIRVMCSSMEIQPTGGFSISQDRANEKQVWDILFRLLEYRMSRGEFTVVDATCSKTRDIQRYRELAESYRYRMFIVDFTGVPLETCLRQNEMRPSYKRVPASAIENIYARFATQGVPSGVKVIQPGELDTIMESPIDLSGYRKVVIVGDIHGCHDTLMQYPDFRDGLRDDTEYIFLGDYIDRGNQNVEVLRFISSIMERPNVCLLEGNHERWLYDYGRDIPVRSPEFEERTKPQLIQGGFTQKDARQLYRKCRQMSHFTYNGIEVLACHGGIPNLDTNLLYIPTEKLIKGAGTYGDYLAVAESWMGQTGDSQYLVHGHRNTECSETQVADRVFNLEGKVEFGGQLRIVEIVPAADGGKPQWNVVLLDDCQPVDENLNTEERKVATVKDAVAYLRNNRFVQERELGNGISSFNFTREAFYRGNWSRQTILARGLFIDTINNSIVARSYEKFFRVNEVPSTELGSLRERLAFPVQAYIKENGYLAIVSLNPATNDLFVASKSTDRGNYADWIREQLRPYWDALLGMLREGGCLHGKSLVFECIEPVRDPHIIEYDNPHIVLLDIIDNTLEFHACDYGTLTSIAGEIGCPVKERAMEIADWDSFRSLYNEVQDEGYTYKGRYIEGFVFVDSLGFMTKCKTGYYNLWKKLRGVCDVTLRRGYTTRTGMLTSSVENLFYGYCRDIYNRYYDRESRGYPFRTDIISMRKGFLKLGVDNPSGGGYTNGD